LFQAGKPLLLLLIGGVLFGLSTHAQTKGGVEKPARVAAVVPADVRSSAAYAEVLLRRTEIEADLESLLAEYTDEYPKVKQERFELDLISKESERILAVKAADASKLTAALGKLIVRKVELQAELFEVQQRLGDGHPDVKRAKKKVEVFERAIKEILG
jgi:hypothetical protein